MCVCVCVRVSEKGGGEGRGTGLVSTVDCDIYIYNILPTPRCLAYSVLSGQGKCLPTIFSSRYVAFYVK